MSNEKTYVGGAKEKTGNFGVFHSISFSAQDVATLQANLNAKGYVNLNMNQRKSPSAYGQTHALTIDTWEHQPQGQAPQMQQAPQQFQQPQQQPFHQGAPIPQEFQQVAQQPQQFQQPQQQQPQVGF